jgi:predicted metal-dependent hydrolase
MQLKTQKTPDTQESIDAHGVTVVIERVSWRRSRYVMRLRPDGTVAALIPPRWKASDINDMLHKHRRWLAKRAEDVRAKNDRQSAKLPASLASPLPPKWFKKAAAQTLPPRVACYAKIMKLTPSKISISSGKRQWGCCNARREIKLSYRLLLVPQELADYVIVHELAHIAHLNHGKRFWALVERYVPDYVEKRRTLNKLGAALD